MYSAHPKNFPNISSRPNYTPDIGLPALVDSKVNVNLPDRVNPPTRPVCPPNEIIVPALLVIRPISANLTESATPHWPLGGADLRFCSLQPGTSWTDPEKPRTRASASSVRVSGYSAPQESHYGVIVWYDTIRYEMLF